MAHSSFLIDENSAKTVRETRLDDLTLGTAAESATGANFSGLKRGADAAWVDDVHELTETWSGSQQLYVSGNIGLTPQELKAIAEALTEHSNWTVYLTEKSEGAVYTDPAGKTWHDHQALDNALTIELRGHSKFNHIVDRFSGYSSENILYISFDSNPAHRKLGYIASEAYERAGVGEAQWAGNLDQSARRALRDGRGIIDAVVDTIKVIDRQYISRTRLENQVELVQLELPKKDIEDGEGFSSSVANTIAAAAEKTPRPAPIGEIGEYSSSLRQKRNQYRHKLRNAETELDCIDGRYACGERGLDDLLATAITPYTGLTKVEVDNLLLEAREGAALAADMRKRVAQLGRELEREGLFSESTGPDGLYDQIDRHCALTSPDASISILDIASLELNARIEQLKLELADPLILRQEVDHQLIALLSVVSNPRLSGPVAREAAELRNLFAYLNPGDCSSDPAAANRELIELEAKGRYVAAKADAEVARFDGLLSGIRKSEDVLQRQIEKAQRLEKDAGHEERARLLKDDYERKSLDLDSVRLQVTGSRDSSWLDNYLLYSTVLSTIYSPVTLKAGYHASENDFDAAGYSPSRSSNQNDFAYAAAADTDSENSGGSW